MKRLIGFLIRREACRLAATSIRTHEVSDGSYAPMLWCLTVFFEQYLRDGAEGTKDDFGPKEPVNLEEIKKQMVGMP